MKYQYDKCGYIRTVELNDRKIIDERVINNVIKVITVFNNHKNAKACFEQIREIERRRGSQITLLEQGGNGHNFNKRNNDNHNFSRRHKVKIMGLPIRV